MLSGRHFFTCHYDLINGLAFDYSGKRLATYSDDHQLKIWDLKEDGTWKKTTSWRPHAGTMLKMDWSHSDYGPVLATCSTDKKAYIWKEWIPNKKIFKKRPPRPRPTSPKNTVDIGSNNIVRRQRKPWEKYFTFYAETPITYVSFGPRNAGLILALFVKPDAIKVYKAPFIMECDDWTFQFEYVWKLNFCCISWSDSNSWLHNLMFAAGSDDTSHSQAGKIILFEYDYNAWQWQKVQTVVSFPYPVFGLSFSPNFGRSYSTLAVASEDVYILQIESRNNEYTMNPNHLAVRYIAQLTDHKEETRRVSWSAMGNILASVGNDQFVRLWKPNCEDEWECISVKECEKTVLPQGYKNSDNEDEEAVSKDDEKTPSQCVSTFR